MFAHRRIFMLSVIIFVFGADCTGSSKTVPSFPKLDEFFKRKTNFKRKYKFGKCDVELRQEECLYTTISKKGHCLIFRNLIEDFIPQYSTTIDSSELSSFQSLPVTEFAIDACAHKVSFRTTAEAKFEVVPHTLQLSSVEADITVPVPIADFDIFGDGLWLLSDYQIKVKFNKVGHGLYSLKAAAETGGIKCLKHAGGKKSDKALAKFRLEYIPVEQISSNFGLDILPSGGVDVILRKLDLESLLIKNCKMYGTVHTYTDNYQLLFSGSPSRKEFASGNIRMLVTKSGNDKNLGFLLELQEYSPVALLKKIYGPEIQRVNILRDRNQTIALYVSAKPTENFTNIVASHGTSRWIHIGSKFDAGATLLVTLPFPKRKALDMKVQLFTDGLGFSLPENENLFGDLALGAISPSKIIRVDQSDNAALGVSEESSLYSKIRILKFRYFIHNDTYLAAAENLASVEDELENLMPKGNPQDRGITFRKSVGYSKHSDNLDAFFKRESKENAKRNVERTNTSPTQESTLNRNGSANKEDDALLLAEKLGLLR